jgi:DNA-directed RNA polymerase specialized sigma24 family protein
MAYFEGLSFSEIGQALDIPLGTVKSRMARALSLLREGMGLPAAAAGTAAAAKPAKETP